MAEILALVKLYTDVAARFALETPDVKNVFGWREPARQHVGRRIAWVPGDPGGSLGKHGPARNVGRNPRPLATINELFHCVISAADPDPAKAESELAQYIAARALRDAWERAVYHAAHGTFTIESESWDIDRQNERRYGAALVVVCSVQSAVLDEVLEGVPADTTIETELSELDVTETLNVQGGST